MPLTDGNEILLGPPDSPLRPDEPLFLAAIGVSEHDLEATTGAIDVGAERGLSENGLGDRSGAP